MKEPKILVSVCIYLSILVGLNWGDAAPAPGGISGDIVVAITVGGRATGIYWVETRDAVQHSTIQRTAPTTKKIQFQMSRAPRFRNPFHLLMYLGNLSVLPGTTFHVLYKLNLFFPLLLCCL